MNRILLVSALTLVVVGMLFAQGFGDKPPVIMAPAGNVQLRFGSVVPVSSSATVTSTL